MDLKTIVLDSKPAVVELLECDLVYNDGLRVESDAKKWTKSLGRVPLERWIFRLPDGPK